MKKAFGNFKSEKLKKFEPVESIENLKCEQCKKTYTLHKFESGYSYKDGCDCEMIEAAKASQLKKKFKQLLATQLMTNQSNMQL